MSNWPIAASSRTETLGLGTGTGTSVTSGAANTKGSYATIGTTSFRYGQVVIFLAPVAADRFRVDIAINTGGSDQVIVEDFFFDTTLSTSLSVAVPLPVRVPSGAVIKMRVQASGATRVVAASVMGISQDFPGVVGAARIRSLTDWTSTLPSNTTTLTGTTFTAWAQVMASTPRASALAVSLTMAGDTSRTASDLLVQVGIGGGGSEVALFSFTTKQGTAALYSAPAFIPCDIPAGSRLSFRVQCSAAAADTIGCAAIGLAA